jgi:anaerobic dimethyl sulfoxide reductase subunit B (iron-sulfur subunit)
MAKQLAFFVNSHACGGCKACQVACKDKHDLPVGLRWRRVYEVTGGGWQQDGAAWLSTVFAYNVSLSCNHCDNPVCVSVCPTRAHHKGDDGIVFIDPSKCIGCQYCAWVCPYGAPQYDEEAGVMTKCDLCSDELKAGSTPACVSACPMRALEFGELETLREKYGNVAAVHPLPPAETTQPSIVFKPHIHAVRAETEGARIGNLEEV